MYKISSLRQLSKPLPACMRFPLVQETQAVKIPKIPYITQFPEQTRLINVYSVLMRYNKKVPVDEDESDDESGTDYNDERDSKVVKTKVNSLRADLILHAGLGMARNKVETVFYESRIRVNGEKLPKKSIQLNVGDEIDVVKGISQLNPNHLTVSRVIILDASERGDGLRVTLRRYKSLLIENYHGMNVFKSSEQPKN